MKLGLSTTVIGIIAIVAGILVLFQPDLIRWIIGIFLIVWGILSLMSKR